MQTVSGTFTYNTEHAHRFILILDSKISHMTDYDLKSVRNDIIKKWRTCIIIWLILSVYDRPCSEDSRFFWILLSVGWRLGTRAIWSIMSWRNCASRTPLKGGTILHVVAQVARAAGVLRSTYPTPAGIGDRTFAWHSTPEARCRTDILPQTHSGSRHFENIWPQTPKCPGTFWKHLASDTLRPRDILKTFFSSCF